MFKETKSPAIFYGWFVVAACFAVTFTLGETFWSFGVFFKPLENEFGWSRTLVSSGFTAFLFGYAFSVVVSGRLADKYGPTFILVASALLAGTGISLCSQTDSISQLRFFLLVSGLGAGATWSVPTSSVQRWFYKRQKAGLALGIVVSGVGAGAMVCPPLINYLILSYGWRNAYLIVGILFFVIIILSSLVIKRSPTGEQTSLEGEGGMLDPASTLGLPTAKVVTTASFVGIVFTNSVAIMGIQVVSVHFIPHATDVGITATVSAVALGAMGGFSILGRITSGLVSHKIGWQKTMALSLLGMALSITWLFFLKAEWMLYGFAFCYGVCHGGRIAAWVGVLSEFFGMRSLGELIGITAATGQLLAAFTPYLAGFAFDTTGSYHMVFIAIMVLLLASAFIATLIKKPLISTP